MIKTTPEAKYVKHPTVAKVNVMPWPDVVTISVKSDIRIRQYPSGVQKYIMDGSVMISNIQTSHNNIVVFTSVIRPDVTCYTHRKQSPDRMATRHSETF